MSTPKKPTEQAADALEALAAGGDTVASLAGPGVVAGVLGVIDEIERGAAAILRWCTETRVTIARMDSARKHFDKIDAEVRAQLDAEGK